MPGPAPYGYSRLAPPTAKGDRSNGPSAYGPLWQNVAFHQLQAYRELWHPDKSFLWINECEGTNGGAVPTSGEWAGGSNGTGSVTYDSSFSQTTGGTVSEKFTSIDGSTVIRFADYPAATSGFVSVYFQTDFTIPGAFLNMFNLTNQEDPAAPSAGQFGVFSSGKFGIRDSTTTAATFTASLAANTAYRLDWYFDATAKLQIAQLFIGANVQGTTPDETQSGIFASVLAVPQVTRIRLGVGSAIGTPAPASIWVDSLWITSGAMPLPRGSGATNYTRSNTDNVGITDSTANQVDKANTDNVGITDSTATQLDKANSESVGITDTVTVELTKATTDPVGITDSTANQVDKANTDAVGLTDSLSLDRTNTPVDSVGITDTTANQIDKPITDSIGITDSVSFTLFVLYSDSKTDAVGITDSLALDRTNTPVDPVGLTDSLALDRTNTPTDAVGITDAAANTVSKANSESVGITDSLASQLDKANTDNVGITDSTANTVSKANTDSVGITDSFTLIKGLNPTDSVGITDTVVVVFTTSITDTVGITDTATHSLTGVVVPISIWGVIPIN